MLGYRWDEFDGPIGDTDDFEIKRDLKRSIPRRPAMKSIGFADRTAAMPHADLDDAETYLAGLLKRLLQKRIRPGPRLLRALKKQASIIATHFGRVSADVVIDADHWLAEAKYPNWRKDELRKILAAVLGGASLPKHVGSFGKDEQYKKFAHERLINARPDELKVLLGPFIHEIEKVVFRNKNFVKFVAQGDRFKHLVEVLHELGRKIQLTDHTSYESVFFNALVEAIILPIYCEILRDHPRLPEFLELYRAFVLSENHTLRSKFFTIVAKGFECSGEMDTSLKNGTGNLVSNAISNALTELTMNLVAFALLDDAQMAEYVDKSEIERTVGEKDELMPTRHNFVCEGDDGVESSAVGTSSEAFSRLGFTVKMTEADDLGGGDFCRVDGDLESGATVTDPLLVLGHFGWFGRQHMDLKRSRQLELLKARACSLLATYPNAPILGAFSRAVLRATAHVDMRKFALEGKHINQWHREKFARDIPKALRIRLSVPVIASSTRLLVESRYGIAWDHQLKIEQYFDNINELCFIECDTLRHYWPEAWVDYAARYNADGADEPLLYARYDNLHPNVRARVESQGVEMRK